MRASPKSSSSKGSGHARLLKDAIRAVRSMDPAIRPLASDGEPGGLIEYPGNVVCLLGDHDSFAPELSKRGIQQGLIYREASWPRGAGGRSSAGS